MTTSIRGLLVCMLLAGLAGSGCTVQPLYSNPASGGRDASIRVALSEVAISQADDRIEQEVRNHLIFGLGYGSGEPDNPRWRVDLDVTKQTVAAVEVQITSTTDGEPTTSAVKLFGNYKLYDMDGVLLKQGRRAASAAFDLPRQGFAVARAERDAENRAARELAEYLRLAFAQDLAGR